MLAVLPRGVESENQLGGLRLVNRLPLSALCIGLLVVAIRHTWLMPFALSVTGYERARSSANLGSRLRNLSIIATVLGAAASAYLRPNNWWYFYQGNDTQFFESISWSVARWGVFEHPGLSGGSIADYHWLTYAFFGGLSELARLQPWDGLLKIGTLIFTTTLALLILESRRNRERSLTVPHGLLVLLVVAAIPASRLDSFTFSILPSFAFIIISGMQFDPRNKIVRLALFVLMSVALVFAKLSTAAVVGAILTVTMTSQMMRRKPVSLMPALSLAGVSVVLYLGLLRQSEARTLLGFQLNITSSVNAILSLLDNPILVTNILVWIVLLTDHAGKEEPKLSRIGLATLGVALIALPAHLVFVGQTSTYFGLPAVYLFSLYASRERFMSQEVQFLTGWRTKRLLIPLALLGATATGFSITIATNRIDLRLQLTEHFGEWLLDIVQGSGLTLMIITLLLFASIQFRSKVPLLFTIAIAMGLGALCGQSMNDYSRVATLGSGIYTSSEVNAAAFGSDGLHEISSYIRKSTPQDTVLASNNFCCFGASWFSSAGAKNFRGPRPGDDWEVALGGANYLLPANTQRRFLLQGLRFQTGYLPPTADQINRMRVSLAFANRPTMREVEELKRYNVSGYIVNLSLTERRDWSEFAFEKFRSDEFIYLELK